MGGIQHCAKTTVLAGKHLGLPDQTKGSPTVPEPILRKWMEEKGKRPIARSSPCAGLPLTGLS